MNQWSQLFMNLRQSSLVYFIAKSIGTPQGGEILTSISKSDKNAPENQQTFGNWAYHQQGRSEEHLKKPAIFWVPVRCMWLFCVFMFFNFWALQCSEFRWDSPFPQLLDVPLPSLFQGYSQLGALRSMVKCQWSERSGVYTRWVPDPIINGGN